MILIFEASKLRTDICKTIFETLKHQFHNEYDFVQHRYFELFSRHGQYFHPTKDQPPTRSYSTFLYTCCNFGQIFCTNVNNFFLCKIWVITNHKCAANITWWVYWMRNRGPLLPIFCTFFYPCPLLTNSALFDWHLFDCRPHSHQSETRCLPVCFA